MGRFTPPWREDQEYEAGRLIQGTAILWEKDRRFSNLMQTKLAIVSFSLDSEEIGLLLPLGSAAFIPFLIEDL